MDSWSVANDPLCDGHCPLTHKSWDPSEEGMRSSPHVSARYPQGSNIHSVCADGSAVPDVRSSNCQRRLAVRDGLE